MFPFPELRKGQDAMLDDCRTAFAGGEHLLAHAPTGLGKTAAALTAAVEVAREQVWSSRMRMAYYDRIDAHGLDRKGRV